ncbi:MAG: 4-hydroxybutyrate CoA-transferase [Acidobacteria bacterium]|nr:MAG: 4-hydroxybutyrate CoA-transferase [Acidobacteriota bacterium]
MSPIIAKSPVEAVSSIESGENIWTQSMAATPGRLLEGLCEHAMSKKDIKLFQLHTEGAHFLADPKLKGHLRNMCYFVGSNIRKLVQKGEADYIPIFLSQIPVIFRRRVQPLDTTLVQVSPPDAHGMCTLGISVEATKAAIQASKKVIAHINPSMPRAHGDAFVPYDAFHAVYEEDVPLPEIAPPKQTETTKAIGQSVASLIEDGSTLQMGIGAIPDAALACLGDRKDLGIHTEMFSDGILPLVESGVINNIHKVKHPGKTVTGFAMGTRKLYDFIDDNPSVVFLDIEYVNNTAIIRQNPKAIAINSALQIDITGQVCADSIGTNTFSGVGGQMDFVRGAALSRGGKAIIALPSSAKGGTISRIVSTLTPGSGVVTTRAHVQYIVTEYGIADMRGKSTLERARELINIAHPNFREQLKKEAREIWDFKL